MAYDFSIKQYMFIACLRTSNLKYQEHIETLRRIDILF